MRSRSARKAARAAFTRGLSALIATMLILSSRTATGSPGDLFTISAPAIGDAPPATAAIADGDSGVATNTGAFTYGYPISAPPGRNGMQPNISGSPPGLVGGSWPVMHRVEMNA